MAYRNGNYTAFYVTEPFHPSSLGANATKDFQYYNTLRMWKGADATFPFVDSHDKTYSVRDGSDWEYTLKPRLRERLRNSKNIILLLSSITTNSRALREEIDYGINDQGLPVIVVYPEYATKESLLVGGSLKQAVKNLWGHLPVFLDVPPILSSTQVWSPIPSIRRLDMKKRFSEEQIIGFLREAEAGVAVKDLCRRHGFSEASYYLWRSKFGGMSVPDAKRLKDLEAENTRLKKLLAEQVFENDLIKDALRKKW